MLKTGKLAWEWSGAEVLTARWALDTRDMASPYAVLAYPWPPAGSDEPKVICYRVGLATTVPRFGGLRWWLLCPLIVGGKACGRRTRKLYLPPAGRYFGCRGCHRLTYRSCQESHRWDALYGRLARGYGEAFHDLKRRYGRIVKGEPMPPS